MTTDNAVLQVLVDRFTELAGEVQERRFAMGDTVLKMLEHNGGNMADVVRRLKAAVPKAADVLGYALTKKNLEALATMAREFQEAGGLQSPDTAHRLSREDMQSLDLTPTEGKTLTDLLTNGKVRIKTVADIAERVQKDDKGTEGKRGAKAVARLREMLATASETGPVKGSLPWIEKELARTEATIEKARKREETLRKQLAEAKKRLEDAAAKADREAEAAMNVARPTRIEGEQKKPKARKAGEGKGKRPAPQANA